MNRYTFLDILVLTENDKTHVGQIGNGKLALKTIKTNYFYKTEDYRFDPCRVHLF